MAETVGQILAASSIIQNLSTQPSQSPRCDCGGIIEPLKLQGQIVHWPKRCAVCRDEYAQKLKLEEAAYGVRRQRKDKAQSIRDRLYDIIPPIFQQAHLRNLNKVFCKELLNHNPKVGLVLFGPVGCGKSYSLAALIRKLIVQGKMCQRVTYGMLCLLIRDTYKVGSRKSEKEVIQPYLECDCLFVEDVGSITGIGKQESDFSTRTFYDLLDTRLEQCRPTFISTNKNKQNLAISFDERIASRLSMFKWIGVGGKDKRKV